MTLVLGLLAALGASALFNVGVALQALEARDEPRSLELRLGLLARLLRRPLWLAGLALGLVGVAPQALAFRLAPFVVVQPALAAGLLLLLAIGARALDEHVGVDDWLGVVAIVAGIALVAGGAPAHVETHRGIAGVVGVVAGLGVVALLPFPLRGSRLDSALLVVVAGGAGFAGTNVATKLGSDDLGRQAWASAAAWALVALALGVAATITSMTALQRRDASLVVPLTTAIQIFLPILLEPFFLREHWSSAALYGAPAAAGVALAALGTVLVARTAAVSSLAADAQGG